MGLFAKQPALREQNFIVPSSFSALPFYSVIKIIDTPFYSDRMRRTQPPQPFLYSEMRKGRRARRWVPQGKLLVYSVKSPFTLIVIPGLTKPAPYLIRGGNDGFEANVKKRWTRYTGKVFEMI